ncbi:MAG: branched-chain amino acid transport system permease protein [Spirochaetes bacterium]|nr:MAG: branched-chain amino acid transport system permease protein [Spirochaetota bacterium]
MKGIALLFSKLRTYVDRRKKIFLPTAAAVLLLLPFAVPSQYILRIITMIGVYSVLALSLNLVTGYTGQVSLGHAAFYAIGAYTSAILSTKLGFNFFLSAPVGAVLAGMAGLLLGLPTLRLSGSYLSITTMGFAEVVRMLALNWESLTNGPMGIQRIPRPILFGVALNLNNKGLYYLMLAILVLTTYSIGAIVQSRYGRALTAIRDDELAATMMGVRTMRMKVFAFVVSAFFCGLAGAFYAHMINYIDPNSFTFDTSIVILSIVILGGMGTMTGPFLGALLLISFPELLRFMQEYRFVVYGVILVVMMRFRPQGFLGGQKRTPYHLPRGVDRPLEASAKE